jgi:hypothetical protein
LFAGSVLRAVIQYGTLGNGATGVKSASMSKGNV